MPPVEPIIINTGPLLALQRGGVLGLLGSLDREFHTTEHVVQELARRADKEQLALEHLHILPLKAPFHASLAVELDAGEASVIQAAKENGIPWVCIDELAGRFKAAALGLEVVGTLGLVLRAKRMRLILKARPVIERMSAQGSWFAKPLVERLLESVGE